MGFNIVDISTCTPQGKKYLFDTNIWLMILNPKFPPSKREQKYLKFWEKIINYNFKPRPKIVLLSLMLSEIINSYMKGGAFKRYARKVRKSIDEIDFKKDYRITEHYKIQYHLLCDEIKKHHNYYEFVSDEFKSFKPSDYLKHPPISLDFNDHYYYRFAKKKGYTIVTDDEDFFVEDVEIITANQKLLYKRIS